MARKLAGLARTASLTAVLIAAVGRSYGVTNIVVLPLALQTPERTAVGWEGYVIADMANRALGASRSFAVPDSRQWTAAIRKVQQPLGLTDTPEEAQAAGGAFGLDMIVFGGYRVSEADILVDCQMVAPKSGQVVFSQSFRGPSGELGDVAMKIARRCAEEVSGARLGLAAARAATATTSSASALEALGKGLFYRDRVYAADAANDAAVLYESLSAAVANLATAFNADPSFSWAQDALVEMCRKVLEVDPSNAAAQNNIGLVLRAQGDFRGAVDSFRGAVQHDPDNLGFHLNMANALADYALTYAEDREEQLDKAVQEFQQIISRDPNDVAALIDVGALYLEQNKGTEAVRSLEKAVQLAPEYAAAHLALGLAYAQAGNREDARTHFLRASELDRGSVGRRAEAELRKL